MFYQSVLSAEPAAISPGADPLLALADPTLNGRIVVLSPGALKLTCAMIRLGYAEVTVARVCERPRAREADIVLVPEAMTDEALERAAAFARVALVPLGTIAVRLAADSLVQRAMQRLTAHGFTAVRSRKVGGDVLLRAELPMFGHPACA